MNGTDDGMAAIAARFGAGAGISLGRADEGAALAGEVAMAAGLPLAARRIRAVFPLNLPPGLLTLTTVGSYLDLPMQFGPRTGWFWDVTALSVSGFTAGAIAVTKNAPLITASGAAWAIEPVASFPQAGVISFGQKGIPLLDACERLIFTVTAALTGYAQISGQVVAVPAERIDEYLS